LARSSRLVSLSPTLFNPGLFIPADSPKPSIFSILIRFARLTTSLKAPLGPPTSPLITLSAHDLFPSFWALRFPPTPTAFEEEPPLAGNGKRELLRTGLSGLSMESCSDMPKLLASPCEYSSFIVGEPIRIA